jgi:carbon-monoxide dehydrogenase medium subunit
MGLGLFSPERVVSIRALEELRVCRHDGDELVVGAGLTHQAVASAPLVAEHAPLLAEVSAGVGNIRVRCTGTVGGNLAFAEPRSDVAAVLVALGARIELVSSGGSRVLTLEHFLLGAYETDLRPGELILAVRVPSGSTAGVYRKVVLSERPVVGVALAPCGTGWRLVVGAVGMNLLVHDLADLGAIDPAALAAEVEPTSDLGGSEEYKRHLTQVTIRRCLRAVGAGEEAS